MKANNNLNLKTAKKDELINEYRHALWYRWEYCTYETEEDDDWRDWQFAVADALCNRFNYDVYKETEIKKK